MAVTLETLSAEKKKLDAFRPFSKEILTNLEKWFEVELTYSSNAIEGNTLTRQETALVLEKGLTVGGKPLKDHLEAINHLEAIQAMKEMTKKSSVSLEDILSLHQVILKGIDGGNAGLIRAVPVRISGSTVVLPNPLKVPILLEEFVAWMQRVHEHPVYFAALAHYKLVTIHPFIDGNGRTARLLMNLILIHHGYPPAIISPKDRLPYIKSLEKAQLGGSLEDYCQVIYEAVQHSLEIYTKALGYQAPKEEKNLEGLLKIGELRERTGESISALRYWTKLGLIEAETTTPSGYQLYHSKMIARCQKTRNLQEERYTLEEILELLKEGS
jgi:Fic family protein